MKRALSITGRVVGTAAKLLNVGALLIGHFAMNCVGILICAITD